jgi:hypothetical protein
MTTLFFFFFILYIRYKEYRDEQAKRHAAWREREEARQAAIARGDANVPPAEPDPTAEKEIGLLDLLKFVLCVLVGILLVGKFVTGEWMWGGGGNALVNLRRQWWWPQQQQQRLFSERLLGTYDGNDPDKPIYIAVRCVALLFGIVSFRFVSFRFVSFRVFSLLLSAGAGDARKQGAGLFVYSISCRLTELADWLLSCRSTETSTTCRAIDAFMAQEGPTHSCTFFFSISCILHSCLRAPVPSRLRNARTAYT